MMQFTGFNFTNSLCWLEQALHIKPAVSLKVFYSELEKSPHYERPTEQQMRRAIAHCPKVPAEKTNAAEKIALLEETPLSPTQEFVSILCMKRSEPATFALMVCLQTDLRRLYIRQLPECENSNPWLEDFYALESILGKIDRIHNDQTHFMGDKFIPLDFNRIIASFRAELPPEFEETRAFTLLLEEAANKSGIAQAMYDCAKAPAPAFLRK